MALHDKRSPGTALVVGALVVGAIIGGAVVEYWLGTRGTTQTTAQQTPYGPQGDINTQIKRLNDLVPSQSHTMSDVGYHWAALWFAAKDKNWPLAKFFFGEARQHIRWTIAIRPVRKGPDGNDVNIKGIYDAIEPSVLAAVQLAIEDSDSAAFEMTYREALDKGCYACHKAAGLPFLRPMIPTAPPQTIINYDPAAKWPE